MCIEELSNSSWDGLCIGNRKPHAHKMHWGGGVSQSHLLPVLCQSSGSDRNAWVWQRGLPCQSLRTSPWMVPHLRYRLHHLQRFCLACREWRGSVSHKQAKSESMCKPFFFFLKKAPCLWSFRNKKNYCPYCHSASLSKCSLGGLFWGGRWNPTVFWRSLLPCWKGTGLAPSGPLIFIFFFCKGKKNGYSNLTLP